MKKNKEKNATMEENMPQTDNVTAESNTIENEEVKTAEQAEQNNEAPAQADGYVDYEAQIAEWKDKYVRLAAEFDNYRRRTLKEKAELIKTAGEETLLSILPVVDDFERGIKNLDTAKDIEAVKEGVFLIYNKFSEFLAQKGVKEIEALNSPFNVDLHEAITKIPAPTEELKGKVVDVVQKGYTLGEKIMRYSKVVVGE